MEGEEVFLKKRLFPLQTTPFSQKLLNKQKKRNDLLTRSFRFFCSNAFAFEGVGFTFLISTRWLSQSKKFAMLSLRF